MKTKKIITTLVLMLVALVSLCGCAKMEYIRTVDGYGVIIDKLVVSLDESKINKAGKSLEEVANKISSDFDNFIIMVGNWKENFNDSESYSELYEKLKTGIKVSRNNIRNKELTLSIEFSNWQMFGLFYGFVTVGGQEVVGAMNDIGPFLSNLLLGQYGTSDMGIFLYKYSRVTDEGFIKNLQNKYADDDSTFISTNYADYNFNFTNLYNDYRNFTNNSYDINDLDIVQIFAYPDERLYSNCDEDEVFESQNLDGLNMMYWNLSDKDDDYQMEIYKVAPKSTAWYVVALVISAVVVAILIIRMAKNSKNKVTIIVTKEEVEKNGE